MMRLDDFWTDGDTGVAILPEPHPCGHAAREQGCGGCDPGAVEFVRDDGGPWVRVDEDVTIFDPDLGERAPMVRSLDEVIRRNPGLLYGDGRGGLTIGVDAINQGRRHVMPRTLTLG